LGTGATGNGTDVRLALLRTRAGTLAGRTIPTPRTAAVMAVTSEGLDGLEFSRSDDAQQLSACACVSTRSDPELWDSPLCIGQSPPVQQAMRASGVCAQPAQTAAFPALRPRHKKTVKRRWTKATTPRMADGCSGVKPEVGTTAGARICRPESQSRIEVDASAYTLLRSVA
jgi:hypothetical protein